MRRRSITERYDDLDHRADELAGGLDPFAGYTATHRATVDVFSQLLTMGERVNSGDTPQHLRVLMRMIDKSRPLMFDGLAKVPPAQIRAFMIDLRAKIDAIIDADDGQDQEGTRADELPRDDDAGADHPRADIAQV